MPIVNTAANPSVHDCCACCDLLVMVPSSKITGETGNQIALWVLSSCIIAWMKRAVSVFDDDYRGDYNAKGSTNLD